MMALLCLETTEDPGIKRARSATRLRTARRPKAGIPSHLVHRRSPLKLAL